MQRNFSMANFPAILILWNITISCVVHVQVYARIDVMQSHFEPQANTKIYFSILHVCIHNVMYSVLFTDDDKACEVGEKNMSLFVQSIDQVTIMLTMKTLLARNVFSPIRKW